MARKACSGIGLLNGVNDGGCTVAKWTVKRTIYFISLIRNECGVSLLAPASPVPSTVPSSWNNDPVAIQWVWLMHKRVLEEILRTGVCVSDEGIGANDIKVRCNASCRSICRFGGRDVV